MFFVKRRYVWYAVLFIALAALLVVTWAWVQPDKLLSFFGAVWAEMWAAWALIYGLHWLVVARHETPADKLEKARDGVKDALAAYAKASITQGNATTTYGGGVRWVKMGAMRDSQHSPFMGGERFNWDDESQEKE